MARRLFTLLSALSLLLCVAAAALWLGAVLMPREFPDSGVRRQGSVLIRSNGGVGWNRFSTRGGFDYPSTSGGGESDLELDDARWSLFADLAWALPVGSLVVEGGWMSGGDAITGYDTATHGYDPGQGTVFGSLGLRISL